MSVYIAAEIAEVIALHPCLRDPEFPSLPIRDQIAIQAETLYQAHKAGDPRTRFQILCWWPEARGRAHEEALTLPFDSVDAQDTLSREYGFDSWEVVDGLGEYRTDPDFETALTAMLAGDIDRVSALLAALPALTDARSAYGHKATLLHYLGSNGVETHRQHVPLNAAEIAAKLIDFGADRRSQASMYGGGQTPLALASTSIHPRKAGIAEALRTILDEAKDSP